MALASLRFGDAREMVKLPTSKSAFVGESIAHKDKSAKPLIWPTPIAGLAAKGLMIGPIMRQWERVRHAKEGGFGPFTLFPFAGQDWPLGLKRGGARGTAQSALSNLEREFGFNLKLTLRSFRNFCAKCAHRLLYPREGRGKLGHWATGSAMPDRYDRAICATELRLRNEILNKVATGWRPTEAYEVPNSQWGIQGDSQADTQVDTQVKSDSDSTSVTSTASFLKEEIDISNLYV